MGMVESRAGCTRRDAEHLCDLRRGVPLVVMEHEERPLFRREPAESAFELVPVGQGYQGIGRLGLVGRQDPEVHGTAALARRLFDAFADDDAVEPRIESVRIAEPTEVAPGDHQRVLQSILGPTDVAEDPLSHREQSVRADPDQVDKRRLITALP